MTTENNHKNQTTKETENGLIHGRTYNSQNPAVDDTGDSADISAVDQQEGTMNHGETGDDSLAGNNEGVPGESTA